MHVNNYNIGKRNLKMLFVPKGLCTQPALRKNFQYSKKVLDFDILTFSVLDPANKIFLKTSRKYYVSHLKHLMVNQWLYFKTTHNL